MPTYRFTMVSDRYAKTRLVARCCHGAFFGLGFVFTVLALVIMFWIAWCYFGLAIVQISDTQRRAIVNYSYTTSKPVPTPTISSLIRSTTSATEETSSNSISKLLTTESLLRGSSRGESQVKINKRKEAAVISSLAKGDFAARDRATHNDSSAAKVPFASTAPPPRSKDEPRLNPGEKASILTGPEDSEEDRIYARKVLPSGSENRPEEKRESIPRLDIAPTKVYDAELRSETSRVNEPDVRPSRDDARSPDRDNVQSSRRPDSETAYREPDFDRENPRPPAASSSRGASRYDDDFDEDRGSRGRYDKRDRGRQSDDRLSKGDTRVYPDDRDLPVNPPDRLRERYPDDSRKRGDDDRYDDRRREDDDRYDDRRREDRPRYRDRDSPVRDDRYRDDDRSRTGEDRYRDRDDERYRSRNDDRYRRQDDDRYRTRDDDRYRYRDEDKYKSRDDERYRDDDDDRYRSRGDERYRGDDDKYKSRDDERYKDDDDRYKIREEDRYKARDDDRNHSGDRKDIPPRSRDQKDDYRPRGEDISTSRLRDTDYRESPPRSSSSLPIEERKSTSSRSSYETRAKETITPDRSRPRVRGDVNPSRLSRPSSDEDRYRERDRDDAYRPDRYDGEIYPTRTRNENSFSESSVIDSRPRDVGVNSRYVDTERSGDRYYDRDDRPDDTKLQGSRSSSTVRESSRRYPADDDRRTRLPNERIGDRTEEVELGRRSYSSDDEYRKREASRKDEAYDDEVRRSDDQTRRRYRDDERYPPRDSVDDDDYKRDRRRNDYNKDRNRSPDRYDDDEAYRRYDDRYPSRDDRLPPLPVRSRYDDEESRRRDSEMSNRRKDGTRDREENLRPSSSSRNEQRSYGRDEYPESPSRRRYDDDLPVSDSRSSRDDYSDDPRYSKGSRKSIITDGPVLGSSMSTVNSREPTDIVIREKRYQTSDRKQQSSRYYGDDDSRDRNAETRSREQVQPLGPKDVIELANRHSDGSGQNFRKVDYPVFDPRGSNLTSPEIIRPSERRGTIITAKKRRSV